MGPPAKDDGCALVRLHLTMDGSANANACLMPMPLPLPASLLWPASDPSSPLIAKIRPLILIPFPSSLMGPPPPIQCYLPPQPPHPPHLPNLPPHAPVLGKEPYSPER